MWEAIVTSDVARMCPTEAFHLGEEIDIVPLPAHTLLVKEVDDAEPSFQQLQRGRVVHAFYGLPFQPLALVFVLYDYEYVCTKEGVERGVGG